MPPLYWPLIVLTLLEEGIACYRMFLSGMLDITDNIAAGDVVAPERVVR